MSRKRTIVTLAALGGFTAALTLMSGLPGARADELSELRANNQLLQQRLDQLAAAATAAPVQPGTPSLAGSFPRSFLIPGTDTSIRVGGFVRLNVNEFFSGAAADNGINGEPNNTIAENGALLSTPLNVGALCISAKCAVEQRNHARDTGNFGMNVRESRLRVETRTPTAWGPANTVIEFDFAGGSAGKLHVPDSLALRLRLAYGTLGPWLAGQAYSLFNDLQSHATTLDFGGQVGASGTVRAPQLRYTWKAPGYPGLDIAGDIEMPDTTLIGPNFATDRSQSGTDGPSGFNPTKNSYPDVIGRIDFHQPWGHLSVRGVLTNDEIDDGRFINRTYLGYGGAISGDVKPLWFGWTKDDITWGFAGGTGMNRYFNDATAWDLVSNMTAIPTSAAAANAIFITQASGWEGHVGYEHWWTPSLRSNFSGAIERQDFPSTLLTNFGASGTCASGLNNCWQANKELISAHFNLVWSPVSFVDTGIEYVYGHRLTNAGYEGNVNALIGQFTVKF